MGTVPNYLKEAFRLWVESWGWLSSERTIQPFREVVLDVGPAKEDWPLAKLLGKLWHCTDSMAKDLSDRMDLPDGATYAQAAQAIMAAAKKGRFHIPRSGYRVPG